VQNVTIKLAMFLMTVHSRCALEHVHDICTCQDEELL
jgi:hypothetical protein